MKVNEHKFGVISGIIAFSFWGFLTLYWRILSEVGATQILVNRIFWGFFTLFSLVMFSKKYQPLAVAKKLWKDKKRLGLLVISTSLLAFNWLLYIYSMVSDQILEASLGYYINPIISILLGVIFLREKLPKYQLIAAILAGVAVTFLTLAQGAPPWMALGIATSFGFYGLLKKLISIDSMVSLWFEMAIMLPFASFFFFHWIADGTSAYVGSNGIYILLLTGAGMMTVIPLFFFSKAATLLPLKTLGFLQYIQPTIQFMIAVFINGESFPAFKLIGFSVIWFACLIFSLSGFLEKMNGVTPYAEQ